MHMQWPSGLRISENQAAWPILVIGIILDHLTRACDGLMDFRDADVPDNALVHGVLGKLVLPPANLFPDLVKY